MSEHTTKDGTVIEITKELDVIIEELEFIPLNGNTELFAKIDGKTKMVHKNLYKIKK